MFVVIYKCINRCIEIYIIQYVVYVNFRLCDEELVMSNCASHQRALSQHSSNREKKI